MNLPTDEELERKNRHLLDSRALRAVSKARTPNEASSVDEEEILRFSEETNDDHTEYVNSVLSEMEREGAHSQGA